jgi:hypothetical protein
VPKARIGSEKNMTAKEMGIEGVPDQAAIPNDPANTVKNGESLAQKKDSPIASVAASVINSDKSVEEPK